MSKYRNEAHEFFNSMSREELKELLEDVGFEVSDGDGEIIYTDEIEDREIVIGSVNGPKFSLNSVKGTTFSLNQANNFKINGNQEVKFKAPLDAA